MAKFTETEYRLRAQRYAERYGIIKYHVLGSKMVFYDNHREVERVGDTFKKVSYTMKRTVNLETGAETSQRLKRLNKEGWQNV